MSLNGRRWQLWGSKGLKHCQNAFKTSYKVKKVDKVAVLFKSSENADNENDVKKMKIGFWVEQCLHALIEFQEDVNEMTKNHTKAVSG